MNKKRIFIMAYARKNLGDDIFIKMLIEKYKNIDFYIRASVEYEEVFKENSNINILPKEEENFDNMNVNEYDGYIYIGGSIFMEGGKVYNLDKGCNEFIKKCKKNNVPFYYVSSNFGPYQTKKYFELAKDTFNNCTDICFRDKYSYNLFKEIKSVRYAPDLIFSLDINLSNKIKNTVGISVIDLSIRKSLKQKEEDYKNMIANNIINFIKLGKSVYLFSFCKIEGDERAIEEILMNIPEEYKKNIHVVNYDGNIEEYIKIYSSVECIICARFHSMILSYICNQKIYVTSYSDKIDNVIRELELCKEENLVRLENISSNNIIKENMFSNVDNKKLNIIKEEAKKQFEAIECWINKN